MLTVFDVFAADGAQVGRYWRLNDALGHAERIMGEVKIAHSDRDFNPQAWDSSLPFTEEPKLPSGVEELLAQLV